MAKYVELDQIERNRESKLNSIKLQYEEQIRQLKAQQTTEQFNFEEKLKQDNAAFNNWKLNLQEQIIRCQVYPNNSNSISLEDIDIVENQNNDLEVVGQQEFELEG